MGGLSGMLKCGLLGEARAGARAYATILSEPRAPATGRVEPVAGARCWVHPILGGMPKP